MIRCTCLADLVNTVDPKLVAATFGMDPQATLTYVADHIDPGRLPDQDFAGSLSAPVLPA